MYGTLNFLLLIIFVFGCSRHRETVFQEQELERKPELKFCVVGNTPRDTGLIQSLEKENCDRLFLLGNLPDEEALSAFYAPLFKKNPELQIDLVLGNHDHKDTPAKWISFGRKDPHFFFPNYYYMITEGDLCLVALDTNFYFYREKVKETAEQTEWLSKIKNRLNQCKAKVVFTNHSYEDAKRKELLRAFLDTFVAGKFDEQFASHVHSNVYQTMKGTHIQGLDNSHYGVFTWKRTEPSVINTEIKRYSHLMAENQEILPDLEYDDIIDREVVEQGPFARISNFFKKLFRPQKNKQDKKEQSSNQKKQKEEENYTSNSGQ